MTKPRQSDYACLIKRCFISKCRDPWFIGKPEQRYCEEHKQAIRKVSYAGGTTSKLSEEEVREIQWLFLRKSASEIAREYGISRGHVYRVVKGEVRNVRKI